MKELIERLYPDQLDSVLEGISRLLDKYGFRAAEDGRYRGLTHKDAILITYGDAIQQEGENPLYTLKRFSSRYLKGRINTVHLLPCFPYTSDDGFSVTDYYQIDPGLGNWKDIEALKRHFDLMFDAVVNHISQGSDWFQGFLKGEEAYRDYFIEADPDEDHSQVVRPRALPLLHEFDKQGEAVHIWTTFSRDQVDLNYANYKVFLHVLDVLLFYVSQGARFIRLDAIAFLWKKAGTSCIHLEETHLVIQAYREVLDSIEGETFLITETNVPHKENISYFGNGTNEAHMVYNFTLPPLLALAIHKQDPADLINWAGSLDLPGDKVCFFNFTASHDGVGVRPLQGIVPQEEINFLAEKAIAHGGFVSYKDNGDGTRSPYELNCNYMDLLTHATEPLDLRVRRFLLSQSVMLCMPGVPGVYYHSLLGSENDRDAALDSRINRRINRAKLQFDELEQELQGNDTVRVKVFEQYSKMLEKRTEEPLFHPAAGANYSQSGNVLCIERTDGDNVLYGLHNFSDQAVALQNKAAAVRDLLNEVDISENDWNLEPFGFLWLKKL
ncbi:alpha-amylase family glycosyl hydrolase [Poritiphilus flavus]|uniref:Sugar phosphorylase n=1 Tax=Poritiphilus flavus TaxID=2697053 RepID=A0A6L9EC51_9FLAO|nr:alpha-amylase family glycosyl hydrolase [Poritiphilus flavus]NAS11989.1 sugar phosphorylase [Poritiphilus flavus]